MFWIWSGMGLAFCPRLESSKNPGSRACVPDVSIAAIYFGISRGINGIEDRLLFAEVGSVVSIIELHGPVCAVAVPTHTKLHSGHLGTPLAQRLDLGRSSPNSPGVELTAAGSC